MGDTPDGPESGPTSAAEHTTTIPPLLRLALLLALAWATLALPRPALGDSLDRILASRRLSFGADEEGGAPTSSKMPTIAGSDSRPT